MEATYILSCVLYVCCLIRMGSCLSDNRCWRQIFYEIPNATSTADVLMRTGPQPVDACRRACLLYGECFSFSIQWHDDTSGTCSIYRDATNSAGLMEAVGITLYMPCPRGFNWYTAVRKCYSSAIQGPATAIEAMDICKQMYPDAVLVEPRDDAQLNTIIEMAGTGYVWLGLYRPVTSSDVYDIRYYSSGSRIEYSKWIPEQPDDSRGIQDCVRLEVDLGQWNDRDCTRSYNVICEIN